MLSLARESDAEPQPPARGESGGRARGGGAAPRDVNAWLHIGEDGSVSVYTGKAEVGQNIRTSLAQAVAEELAVPLGSVKLVMADTARTPFDMGTFGSRTTPAMAPQLRRAAAAAREALIDLAASQWQVPRDSVTVAKGQLNHVGTGRSIAYGKLTEGKALVKTIGGENGLTPASRWSIAGTSVSKVEGLDFVTGRHRYASDIARPGMLHGKVMRPPAYGSTLQSLDTSAAEVIPGVKVVHEGEFVAAAAPQRADGQPGALAAAPAASWKAIGVAPISDSDPVRRI